ncbi:MAG: hypothetical protein U0992_11420 [Planctomycetaceae bacterium]
MTKPLVFRGQIVFPDRVARGAVSIRDGRFAAILGEGELLPPDATVIDAGDGYISPGFVDLHVHAAGGDFMDGTAEAFQMGRPPMSVTARREWRSPPQLPATSRFWRHWNSHASSATRPHRMQRV